MSRVHPSAYDALQTQAFRNDAPPLNLTEPRPSVVRPKVAIATLAGAALLGAAVLGRSRPHPLEREFVDVDGVVSKWRSYDQWAPGNLKMPAKISQYNGIEDTRDFPVAQEDVSHVFIIGDWGALLPGHGTARCKGWDCGSQWAVAGAMKGRAWLKPQYVLNVGDSLYWGGTSTNCNQPPGDQGQVTRDMHDVWVFMYGDLAKIPWIGTLGNHDYGGFLMLAGWPQMLGYSFTNHNWIMPARYFSRKVQHKGYVAEYFSIDSNAFDAHPPEQHMEHNICSYHNPKWATCWKNDGMPNIWACKDWFWRTYMEQKAWLQRKLYASDARWKIAITHFPCGTDSDWWRALHERLGLDFLVTGHRHQQELWRPNSPSHFIRKFMEWGHLGTLPCVVSGGGGGIVAENYFWEDWGTDVLMYGFFDMTMTKDWIDVALIGTDSKVHGNYTFRARGA